MKTTGCRRETNEAIPQEPNLSVPVRGRTFGAAGQLMKISSVVSEAL
jgi:hypothetical protein